jgi:hypothetical protein
VLGFGAAAGAIGLSLVGDASGAPGDCATSETTGLSGLALVRHQLARLLEADRLELEAGYLTLEDGMMMVASIHHLREVNGPMIAWWSGRRKSDEEFRMWHPLEHVRMEYDEELGVSMPTHRVEGREQTTKIRARAASEYFDVSRFGSRGVTAAICSRGGLPGSDGWGSHVVHLCRDTDYGCEVRTRMFLGDLEPAPPEATRAAMLRQFSGERAAWMMRHQSEEFAYLSGFLPALYAREVER